MIISNDVDGLRKSIMSEIVVINLLWEFSNCIMFVCYQCQRKSEPQNERPMDNPKDFILESTKTITVQSTNGTCDLPFELLDQDPESTRALPYLGWSSLMLRDPGTTISFLRISLAMGLQKVNLLCKRTNERRQYVAS